MDNELNNNTALSINTLMKKSRTETSLGWENGLMGISFFFFYYSRYINDEKYENYAYELLEKVLSDKALNNDISYSNGLSGLGTCIDFLIKENFLEDESGSFLNDFDEIIINRIDYINKYDFSFTSGFSGVCRYLLIRKNNLDLVKAIIHKIVNAFNNLLSIDPIFIFPSEVLKDIKLLLLKIEKMQVSIEDIEELKKSIICFEKNSKILHSNCSDYYMIQNTREYIITNKDLMPTLYLDQISKESANYLYSSLSLLSLEKKSLPPWWILL